MFTGPLHLFMWITHGIPIKRYSRNTCEWDELKSSHAQWQLNFTPQYSETAKFIINYKILIWYHLSSAKLLYSFIGCEREPSRNVMRSQD